MNDAATGEAYYWRRDVDEHRRGIGQLTALRDRALADPEFAARRAAEMLSDPFDEYVESVLEESRGVLPEDAELVAGYYAGLIAQYEERLAAHQRRLVVARRVERGCDWAVRRRWPGFVAAWPLRSQRRRSHRGRSAVSRRGPPAPARPDSEDDLARRRCP